jgi:hypothetical protein
MALFNRRRDLPGVPEIVRLMERFGRYEIDVMRSPDDPQAVFGLTQMPFVPLSQRDPMGLIHLLAEACVPAGGWAAYGADRTVVNLVGASPPGDDWLRILDASIEFLRSNYVPPIRIAPYAWDRWIAGGGTSNTWVPLRPPPDREAAHITPLDAGETRPVVKLGPEADANLVLVRRAGDGYVALIDAKWSDEDAKRSQSDWKRATALYDLYLDIAWSIQVRDWADTEIEPFFPAPRALI